MTVISRPKYDEFVKSFSWDTPLAHFDWPATEKFNMAHELCDRWANDPDKAGQVALYYETKDGARGTYTFRQLRDLSNRFANVLTNLGVKRGDRVGGLFPKIPAILPALLGIWKLGAVYVPPILLAFVPGRASSCWPALDQRTHHFSEIRLSCCYNSYQFHWFLVTKDVEATQTVEYS
jgi:acetyl-CoA synthetase